MPLAKPNKIALDASFLLAIPENRARVFEGIRGELGQAGFFVPDLVLKELEAIGKRKGKKGDVEIVKKAMELNNVKELACVEEKADDCLAELASEGFIVATSDSRLKKRIKGFGGRIIYLKKGNLVEIE